MSRSWLSGTAGSGVPDSVLAAREARRLRLLDQTICRCSHNAARHTGHGCERCDCRADVSMLLAVEERRLQVARCFVCGRDDGHLRDNICAACRAVTDTRGAPRTKAEQATYDREHRSQ